MIKDILKRILKYRFHVRGLLNPFIYFQINNLENYPGINNNVHRETPIIVSLTSYEGRFGDLPKTLYSLLNQTTKPDKIILWLNKECNNLTSLPYEITKFIKNGLEIRFVEDLGPYTKWFYAFKEFSNAIIITADDDIYYDKNWLNKLYLSYIAHPEDIHVHRAHRADLNLPYEKWKKQINEENARYDNFITGVGGALYPPNCFGQEIFRKDIFIKEAPNADDIWLWIMALIHNKKIRVVKNHIKTLITTNIFRQMFCKTLYRKNCKGENDKQLNNLLKYYKNNVLKTLKSEKN